jgi:hypothetical protein
VLASIGDVFAFTAEDVASVAGISLDAASAFLDRFAISFGQVEARYRLPMAMHPLKAKPIMHEGK